jgi:hypothetical protein
MDKSSSAELSEAINSMFNWHQEAQVCYAYLADVDVDVERFHNLTSPSTLSARILKVSDDQPILAFSRPFGPTIEDDLLAVSPSSFRYTNTVLVPPELRSRDGIFPIVLASKYLEVRMWICPFVPKPPIWLCRPKAMFNVIPRFASLDICVNTAYETESTASPAQV